MICAAKGGRLGTVALYVNALSDEGSAGVRRAYPLEKLARLTALNRTYLILVRMLLC